MAGVSPDRLRREAIERLMYDGDGLIGNNARDIINDGFKLIRSRLDSNGFTGNRGPYSHRLPHDKQQELKHLEDEAQRAISRYCFAVLEIFHEQERKYHRENADAEKAHQAAQT